MTERPNAILILTDDQGYGDLSCTGNPVLKTPHLDQLYDQSVRLTDYHVDAMCSPTRAALMTGRYAARTGVWSTLRGRYIMRRDEITIADVFADSGYRTGIFGKWHLGDNYPYRPFDRGISGIPELWRRRSWRNPRLLGQRQLYRNISPKWRMRTALLLLHRRVVQRSHAIYGDRSRETIFLLYLHQRTPWPVQRTRKIQRALFTTGNTETARAILRHDRKHRRKHRAPPPVARGQ